MSPTEFSLPDQLVAMAAQTPMAMYMRDREGRYRWFNQAAVLFMGFPPEQIAGRLDDEIFRPDSARRTREEDEEVMRTGKPMITGCRVHTADGRDMEFVVEKYPCRAPGGELLGVFGVARDVTDMRRSRRGLSGVAPVDRLDATPDGSPLNETLLATISHELRTPIHGILGFCSILSRGLAGPLGEGPAGYVTRIHEVSVELSRLVDDLLDLSQARAGTFTVSPAPLALTPLAREVLDQLGPQALRLELQLADGVPEGLPLVMADGVRIRQVLTNLLSNAFKFTPAGGQVTLAARQTNRGVRCEVVDNGCGIAPPDFKRLFEPFSQLEATPRVAGGAGMGLSICRTIIAQHQGEIGVSSDVDRGSTFWFELPLAQA